MLTVYDAVTTHRVCPCDCFRNLTVAERVAGIRAVYHLDDALRGWGYTPIYDVHGDLLFKQAQQKGDPSYRGVAVRFGECIYRRLLGSLVHECLHAVCGDVTKANYGILFGLPYGVPPEVAPTDEEAFLEPFNFGEARAWAGVWIVGKKMFGVDWDLRTARDVGTYCFTGGNALVSVPAGYRAVAHVDRTHHPERYYAKGRRLEERARAWFAEDDNLAEVIARIDAAAALGKEKRPRRYPDAETIAKTAPKRIERNDPCVCGSARKFKECCGPRGTLEHFLPVNAR
ncbi:MAG: SEC-C domain-containing protein [Labilithrix sp.]|nr:SEC-C domain-containing protein [Labilithrix sp.]